MTVDEFRAAMQARAKSKEKSLLFVETPEGEKHIALGMDSKRGVIICHPNVEIDIASARIAAP